MSDGRKCKCAAHCGCECACGADWTPKEVYDLRRELAEARAESALIATLKQRIQTIGDELGKAREYIRARPPFECDWQNLSEHKQGCPCDECGLWRKAAGLDDPNKEGQHRE